MQTNNNPTLCLNMIVKNESKIITRLFDSVLNIIDSYLICDTGSTDNTIELITEYFKQHNIPGKVVSEPFKNFCYNRNFALKCCTGMSDYVLLMDADMKLHVGDFDKSQLSKYANYYILQGSDDFYYKNIRIIKNTSEAYYIGVTHEYINISNMEQTNEFKKTELFIYDIGDGGCKQNKYERDIQLLTNGLLMEPNNVRYYFYLANSYFDLGKMDEAITYYTKRIAFGGWKEEVWYSYYKIGLAYKNKSDMGNAMWNWLEGYNYYPERLEGLYEIIYHYRIYAKQTIGYEFYKMAKTILDKQYNYDSCLFHHNDIYTFKLAYEYTLLAAYVGIHNINNEIVQILNNSNNADTNTNVIKNMKFYKFILNQKDKKIFDDTYIKKIDNVDTKFTSSSSCIINNGTGYGMNVRYVNYYIDEQHGYLNCEKHIITLNKYIQLDYEFKIIKQHMFELPLDRRRYIGIEDVRVFNNIYENKYMYIGTGLQNDNNIGIVHGDYNINNCKLDDNLIELKQSFKTTTCEKNWVLVCYNNCMHVIYEWFPLRLCVIKNNNLVIVKEKTMPKIFRYIRGSSCGFNYNDTIWFVVHLVSYEQPRHYYHMIVVFDKNMNLLRYTAPFKFEGEPIEYCLSITINNNQVYMNYSTWDRTTRIGIYDIASIPFMYGEH